MPAKLSTRVVLGVASLPLGMPVELELVLEVEPIECSRNQGAAVRRCAQRACAHKRADDRSGSMDEIATAIARCAGCPADRLATLESIDSREGRAIHYGGSRQIFFNR